MAFRDLLFSAHTYPVATSDRGLRSGVALAKRLGGDLTFRAIQVDLPHLNNALANRMMDLDALALAEESRSGAAARRAASCITIAASDAGVSVDARSLTVRLHDESDVIVTAARTHDLCLLPIGPAAPAGLGLAEAVLFGSGRPVIVFPEDLDISPESSFDTVMIAWDGSARAARAVADALPILRRASKVHILSVVGEKPQVVAGAAQDLVRHLQAHDVVALVDEVEADGRKIGAVLAGHLQSMPADLLVMGGFGHSRLREFLLGGATASILAKPPCPVLMSH